MTDLDDRLLTGFVARPSLIRDIAPFIYQPIRVMGIGIWNRDEEGHWSLSKMEVQSFELLDEESLEVLLDRMRSLKVAWPEDAIDKLLSERSFLMSAVAFDNTMLSILLNPNGQIPLDKDTKAPVDMAKERAEGLIQTMQKSRRRIVLPTPACAELLTAIGPDAQQYINTVSRSRVFEIASFDARCAAELALLNRDTFANADQKSGAEPYQKIKVDRQIIANLPGFWCERNIH